MSCSLTPQEVERLILELPWVGSRTSTSPPPTTAKDDKKTAVQQVVQVDEMELRRVLDGETDQDAMSRFLQEVLDDDKFRDKRVFSLNVVEFIYQKRTPSSAPSSSSSSLEDVTNNLIKDDGDGKEKKELHHEPD